MSELKVIDQGATGGEEMSEHEEVDEGAGGDEEMSRERQELIDELDNGARTMKNTIISLYDAKSAHGNVLADIQQQLTAMNKNLVARLDKLNVQIHNTDMRTTNARHIRKTPGMRLLRLTSFTTLRPIEDYPTTIKELEGWTDKRLMTLLKHLEIDIAQGAEFKVKLQAAQDAIA